VTCTGPVLYTGEIFSTYFQADPFRPPLTIKGLQMYQSDRRPLSTKWDPGRAIQKCTGRDDHDSKPAITSSVVVGTRAAVLEYFNIAAREVENWVRKSESCDYSDKALHNSLYYSGRLPFAVAVQNRAKEGIAVAVDDFADKVIEKHIRNMMEIHKVSEEKGTAMTLLKPKLAIVSQTHDAFFTSLFCLVRYSRWHVLSQQHRT